MNLDKKLFVIAITGMVSLATGFLIAKKIYSPGKKVAGGLYVSEEDCTITAVLKIPLNKLLSHNYAMFKIFKVNSNSDPHN